MQNVFDTLNNLNIEYQTYEHAAVFTVEESKKVDSQIPAGKTKNLFLRNDKATKYYLVIVEADIKVDIKKLSNDLNESKFSFGSAEKMEDLIGLTPGSVSPFGLINNNDHNVIVVVDQNLLKHEEIGFHPNINTATITITPNDFKKFLEWTGNKFKFIQIPEKE